MLQQLSRSLTVLAPFGVFIYILGVVVRYGTGNALGSVLAVIGVVLFLSRQSQGTHDNVLESDRS